ncbi:putative O-glycosylation ligase, exosortase A system-associated [Falsiroseomonas sp.]|uniref:putative O-glycosylation ligase, exosortase A system-associated n=1 Tax=Falsiroseomonas sp. TaxID=2870721 RepID=UPI0027233D31|nr:putative O-glycosylation ligase, exosortase A system-associated [Falsiroseomonas sp.]MDO9498829.1 putative O-glycosylation ligase, exosortase A system-associated [Falsiroseomonas sp.]
MIRNLVFMAVLFPMLATALAQPFVGILLWSWISFMNPHRQIWGTAAYLPWGMMVIGATLIGCVLAREPRQLPVNAVTVLLALMLAMFTLTTFTGLGTPAEAWVKWDRAMRVIVVLLLTAAMLSDRRRLDALIWLMVIAIGYYGVRGGMFTIMTGGSHRVWGPEQSMIADNNHIGAAMLVALPLMNYLRLQAGHRLVRIGLAAAMVLTLFAIIGTYSRGALLGIAAVIVVMWLRSRHKLLGGIIMAAVLAVAINFMPAQWTDRMNTIGTYEEDQSATTRLKLWEVSFRLALDRPLVGSGFRGPYTQSAVDTVMPGGPARAVHSIWFEVMGEHGFIGFALWLGLTLAGAWYAWRLIRLARLHPQLAWAGDLGRMLQVSIVAYSAAGTFLSLAYWDYYWTLMVIAPAALAIARRSLSQQSDAEPAGFGWRTARAGAATPRPAVAAGWSRQGRAST